MSWYGWLALAVSVLGYVVAWRRLVYAMAYEFGPPDTEDWVAAVFFGSIAAFAWPLLAIALLARSHPNVKRILVAEPKAVRIKRLEAEKREREWYIENLERDLGIGR